MMTVMVNGDDSDDHMMSSTIHVHHDHVYEHTGRRSGDSASPPLRYRPCGDVLWSGLLCMTPTR